MSKKKNNREEREENTQLSMVIELKGRGKGRGKDKANDEEQKIKKKSWECLGMNKILYMLYTICIRNLFYAIEQVLSLSEVEKLIKGS